MKKLVLAISFALVSFSSHAKSVGTQYDYKCEGEMGTFEVSIFKNHDAKVLKIDDEYIKEDKFEVYPKLGSKVINLYFLGAPGEDEQNNVCQLTYTNR